MKHFFLYMGIFGCIVCGLLSCEREGLMEYNRERAAIEFRTTEMDYSFRISAKATDTVTIPFYLAGVPATHDRAARIGVVIDSTTAGQSTYEVVSAIVPGGERIGSLKVRVTKGSDFKESQIFFRVGSNENFIPGTQEWNDLRLNLTNKLVRPSEWDWWLEEYYWGNYSTAYYGFIIEVTGETRFPWPTPIKGYNNGNAWTNGERLAFFEKVRFELRSRNKRVGSSLLHDDGSAKGKEVVVGLFYAN